MVYNFVHFPRTSVIFSLHSSFSPPQQSFVAQAFFEDWCCILVNHLLQDEDDADRHAVNSRVTPVLLRIWAASSSGWLAAIPAAISFNANSKRERGTMDGGGRRELDLILSLKMEEFPSTLHVVMPLFRGGLNKVRQTKQILAKIIGGSPRNLNFETLLKLLGNYYGTLRLT